MMTSGQVTYKQGYIVLVPFPFSNLSSTKIRPVLIISNDSYNSISADVIVCGITSNLKPTNFSIEIDQSDLLSGTLKVKSKIKVDAITALEKSIILKSIATKNPI
jgi:mRNA interferase MazF